jgi:2-keto-4-pentenoate hydratase/2-oxohepta-3-ene-1,7-dioic acid hydratase in catechol pathway
MKLCRFIHDGVRRCGFYQSDRVLPLDSVTVRLGMIDLAELLRFGDFDSLLPTDSEPWLKLTMLHQRLIETPQLAAELWISSSDIFLLPPIARPNKLLLLAGNYAAHIREQGDIDAERESTFPYVFMKPASTTLVGDNAAVAIPKVSPDKIDYEAELAVVIGKVTRGVARQNALANVAGYTIVNDLSDRGFHPNPQRTDRPRDKHFDWMHGKWHDGFCPCGPNLTTGDEIADPQKLAIRLWVDDKICQSGTTEEQIFSVAEIIEFLSSWITLEPGDIIATGTPSGVGNATGHYLKPGQVVRAEISSIGTLTTRIV